jgi:hypothetical protein
MKVTLKTMARCALLDAKGEPIGEVDEHLVTVDTDLGEVAIVGAREVSLRWMRETEGAALWIDLGQRWACLNIQDLRAEVLGL